MLGNLTVEISTKNRYEILSHALMSIAQQTLKPQRVMILDDSDKDKWTDIRKFPIYVNILNLFEKYKIKWEVFLTPQHGQVKNHIFAIQNATTKYIHRLDDDNILNNDVLEKLYNILESDSKIGGAASYVEHPDKNFPECCVSPYLEDVLYKYALQFYKFEGIRECQHFYSTFMARVDVGRNCYPTDLSKIGHSEESQFSAKLFRKGYKLMVCGDCTTYHLRAPFGGIRTYNTQKDVGMWEEDGKIFREKLKAWEIKTNEYFLIVLDGGIGDNFAFKHIFNEIKERNFGKKFIVATVYPDFWAKEKEEGVEIVSIEAAKIFAGDIEKYSPYALGFKLDGSLSLLDCYRKIYGLE